MQGITPFILGNHGNSGYYLTPNPTMTGIICYNISYGGYPRFKANWTWPVTEYPKGDYEVIIYVKKSSDSSYVGEDFLSYGNYAPDYGNSSGLAVLNATSGSWSTLNSNSNFYSPSPFIAGTTYDITIYVNNNPTYNSGFTFNGLSRAAGTTYTNQLAMTLPANISSITASGGTGSASASWTAPNSGGSTNIYYYWALFTSTGSEVSNGTASNTTSIGTGGLSSGSYYFVVTTGNETGFNTSSTTSNTFTVSSVPPPIYTPVYIPPPVHIPTRQGVTAKDIQGLS
jgi:hypothetical protein